MTTNGRQVVASAVLARLDHRGRSLQWLADESGMAYLSLHRKTSAQADFTVTELARIAAVLDISPAALVTPPPVPL